MKRPVNSCLQLDKSNQIKIENNYHLFESCNASCASCSIIPTYHAHAAYSLLLKWKSWCLLCRKCIMILSLSGVMSCMSGFVVLLVLLFCYFLGVVAVVVCLCLVRATTQFIIMTYSIRSVFMSKCLYFCWKVSIATPQLS